MASSVRHTEKERWAAEIEWGKSKRYTEWYGEVLRQERALQGEHHGAQKKTQQSHRQEHQ